MADRVAAGERRGGRERLRPHGVHGPHLRVYEGTENTYTISVMS
jgi:hypothetical protein